MYTDEAVFNEAGSNVDFRVESDSNANMLFVDGTNNRVGIGTGAPSYEFVVSKDATSGIEFGPQGINSTTSFIQFYNRSTAAYDTARIYAKQLELYLEAAQVIGLEITTTEAVINQSGTAMDFRVESDSNAYALFMDANTNCVNIQTSGGVQSIAGLNARVNGAAIEFGHTNNSAGYFGTLGAQGNNGHPYLGFSTSAEFNQNTFKTYGAAGNIIVGDLSGNLLFSQVVTASAVNQTPVERMRIQQGSLVINEPGNNYDFRVESDNNANALLVDAGSDTVCIGTATTSGAIANTSPLTAGRFRTLAGAQSAATATATTLVTLPAGFATYIVNAGFNGVNDAGAYGATAIVHTDGSTNSITQLVNPSGMTISMSGMAVQATQTSGSRLNISFSILRM